MSSPLFPTASPEKTPSVVAELLRTHPKSFSDAAAATRFLQLVYFPASRRWRYQLNGKSGNTFTLNLLFELEFGSRFTSHLVEASNQHPDFALFQLPVARLLSNALKAHDSLPAVLDFPGLSIATVRNPFTRARSGFHYLCRSHALGDRRFLPERLRLNALSEFDWENDAGTPGGFIKFLDYLTMMAAREGADKFDPHWMPQHLHIRPDLYKPDLIGRTEDLTRFATELAQRLDRPLPDLDGMKQNRNEKNAADLYADPHGSHALRRGF
jgi:Sulfotransferase family